MSKSGKAKAYQFGGAIAMSKVPKVIGTLSQGIIAYEVANDGGGGSVILHFIELVPALRRDLSRKVLTRRKSLILEESGPELEDNPEKEFVHASFQYLEKTRSSEKDSSGAGNSNNRYGSNLQLNVGGGLKGPGSVLTMTAASSPNPKFGLLVVVWKEKGLANEAADYYFSAKIYLVKEQTTGGGDQNSNEFVMEKVAEMVLVNKFDRRFIAHMLPPHKRPADEESDTDTTEQGEEEAKIASFKNRVVILNLDENVIQFNIETFPHEDKNFARIALLDSEMVARCFWWAQFSPQYQFLAFAHDRKVQVSSFDVDEGASAHIVKPMLSVLQFHNDFPRESVLNMPLDDEIAQEGQSLSGILVPDPNIITSKVSYLKLCAHSSGTVYLFSLRNFEPKRTKHDDDNHDEKPEVAKRDQRLKLKYSVNLLHHTKTLIVENDLSEDTPLPLKMDVSTFANDQYLIVMGWPLFVHLLDVGACHEPSHHITLNVTAFNFLCLHPTSTYDDSQVTSTSFFKMILPSEVQPSSVGPNGDDKLSSYMMNFISEDNTFHQFHLSPVRLHQLLEKKVVRMSTKMKLALIHYILVHQGDINVCKRIIYDEGKKIGNINLTKIYQEFIVGAAYAQTKKQLLSNMEQFLSLIPYCPHSATEYNGNPGEGPLIELSTNWTEVCTMLLSPSQRVFPHNVTDVWTSLWHMNKSLARSNRFSHKNVADKLLLALQCYKPEALSKASTPMSPSSPMVCASLGDIAGLFGRRATELQLPFVEHESCTANKQEYIFSINLRELSMHLLKERKEYPLLGHTVAGKYVSALIDTARLLCHLACLTVHLQTTKNRDKGFRLIDCMEWETKLRLFMLLEHYALALGKLACPLPQGFTPFFAYLAYKTISFDQFIWHVRAGTFELQIDLVKTIMADLKDSDDESVSRKLRLLSLLPKSRAYRILNSWSHPVSVSLRARQHSSDLLSGTVSQARKSSFVSLKKKKAGDLMTGKTNITALDSFFQLLTGKANANDIDLGLLTEATMLSMEQPRE